MNNNTNKNILTFILKFVITFIACFLIESLVIAQPSQTNIKPLTQDNSVTKEKDSNEYINVMAIDLSGDGLFTEESILWGDDAILLVDLDGKTSPDNRYGFPLGYFNSMQILGQMDDNADGDIDKLDAAYPHMKLLLFLNGGKKFKIVPLMVPGIQSIFLDKARMLTANPSGFADDEPNNAVLSDSTKRIIQLIRVKKELLEKVK